MKATKGNKTYSIDETQRKHYIEGGFDIVDNDGKVLDHGRGKTVPYDEYMKIKESHENLLQEYASLEETKVDAKELKALKKENDELKKALEELQKAGE